MPTEQIKKLTVKWIVLNKKMIKFIEEETAIYKLDDNVLTSAETIKPNTLVHVTIVGDKVIKIVTGNESKPVVSEIVKIETPVPVKAEPVVEIKPKVESSSASEIVKTYKVKAISKTRDYYMFEETGEKLWFGVTPNVKTFLRDVVKGDTLDIKYSVTVNGNKEVNTIIFANVKEKTTQNVQNNVVEQPKEIERKKSSYRDETATDKRTALMTAKDIVVALINSKTESVNTNAKIISTIQELTKVCYETMDTL